MKPNYIAHYKDANTGQYMYSIPYYWPVENDETRIPYYGLKYTTFEEYENEQNR